MTNGNSHKGSAVVKWVGVGLAALVIIGTVVSLFWSTAAQAEGKAAEAKNIADQNKAALVRHEKRLATLEENRVQMVEDLGVIKGDVKLLLERTERTKGQ